MARFALVTTQPANFDGTEVGAGARIGDMETAFPWDNVLASLKLGVVAIVAERDAPASKPADQQEKPSPLSNPTLSEQQPENSLPIIQGAAADSAIDNDPDLDPLSGLTPKLAESLRAATIDGVLASVGSLDTPAKVQNAINSGFDLADLDGIGPKAVTKIKDWLAALAGE
jgi:predicted flap endonuclease-1-like 5' DNA nuclease